ncbi:MAG TPA: hypothetical protein VIK72_16825 [Clostridiaceae bacterium]
MDKNEKDEELNPLEKQISELDEQQNILFNPGYFIGSGIIAPVIKNLHRSPIIILIIGIVIILGVIFTIIVTNFSLLMILGDIIPLVIGCAFTYGGIKRLSNKK